MGNADALKAELSKAVIGLVAEQVKGAIDQLTTKLNSPEGVNQNSGAPLPSANGNAARTV